MLKIKLTKLKFFTLIEEEESTFYFVSAKLMLIHKSFKANTKKNRIFFIYLQVLKFPILKKLYMTDIF